MNHGGLESRYEVKKINDPTGRHDDCRYFVLDPQHDTIARAALARYAQVARAEGYVRLADDLEHWLRALLTGDGACCPHTDYDHSASNVNGCYYCACEIDQ